ncbi:hypothetical protein BDV38DRAFT_258457 [Aspergillus pseudotamarii]|uniref:GET complex, subunit GET2 n=1 Tax=Aspergillus pseudotamarii TaxID=132259 RepID=A0A5N6SFP1_ASPPS|nr:uncharacterized protein BDV38DRAFT_258457 [Aspergillus pseudotamarii]KAE8133425.1 hypothetical protein BDV38DRAFT_258457 [Aspergillus pseudotamarii]
MSSAEESPAQRAARLRRERREAKIKEGGAARLDKITSLSGRTPASMREETSPSPSPSPSPQPPAQVSSTPETEKPQSQPAPAPASAPAQPTSNPEPQSPENLQAQQELFRALLRQGGPSSSEQGPQEEDPTMQMLNTLMAGMNGQDQAPGGAPGGAAGGPSSAELVSALGLPPFVADLLGAATHKPTDEEKKEVRTWKALHVLFAVAVGIYLLMLIGTSVSTYGSQPPPPATAQNPFLYFTTGEVVLTGARLMSKGRTGTAAGIMLWLQLFQDIVRDGSLVVFLLGMGAWWSREWTAY